MVRWLPVCLLLACNDPQPPAPEPTPLASTYTLDDEVGFPEGIAFHAPSRAFFVGSLAHGGITRVAADGTQSRFYTPPAAGWMTLGMKIHPESGELLVCSVINASTASATSELWVFDPDTAARVVFPLADNPNDCNDVVGHGPDVYLTDRESARVHRVTLASDKIDVWFEHPLLEPGLIGNNGIVVTDDDVLIVGQYAPAKLLRIPLSAPDEIAEITLTGDAIGAIPNGADGITWVGDALAIAANQRLLRVESADGWRSATVSARTPPAPIAAVTVAEGQLYGLKGEVVPFVLGLPPDLPFQIVALTDF